jgi:chaperonin GroES
VAIKPLNGNVVVLMEKVSQVGNIIIPDNATSLNPKTLGKVVRVADNSKVNINDTVLFPAYNGTEYETDSKTYKILKEEDLLGVVE